MTAEAEGDNTSVQQLVELVRQQATAMQQQAARLSQLEAEAARVSHLEAEVARLRADAAAGRSVFTAGTTSDTAGDDSAGGESTLSRRGVLRTAGLVGLGSAVAAVGAVASAAPAAATRGPMNFGTRNDAGGDGTDLVSTSGAYTLAVANDGSGTALIALNAPRGNDAAIYARSSNIAPGVHAVAGTGSAVVGETRSTFFGVHGVTRGAGSAVYGQNLNAASTAGVFGEGPGATRGVWGRNTGSNAAGVGVFGESAAGRGASFGGRVAALRLRPSNQANRPSSGQRGDFVVDSTGRLWFCKGGTTWRQLA